MLECVDVSIIGRWSIRQEFLENLDSGGFCLYIDIGAGSRSSDSLATPKNNEVL